MKRIVELLVGKEDYYKVMGIVNRYVMGQIHTVDYGDYYEVVFPCNVLRYSKCVHDINLAISLGVGVNFKETMTTVES